MRETGVTREFVISMIVCSLVEDDDVMGDKN